LGVLLRSIIVEREPIYRQQETVQAFASGMFGLAAEEMAYLGDDRLGRALDRLFDADRTALLTEVVPKPMGPPSGAEHDRPAVRANFWNSNFTIRFPAAVAPPGGMITGVK
jgi:hypothetical protein